MHSEVDFILKVQVSTDKTIVNKVFFSGEISLLEQIIDAMLNSNTEPVALATTTCKIIIWLMINCMCTVKADSGLPLVPCFFPTPQAKKGTTSSGDFLFKHDILQRR